MPPYPTPQPQHEEERLTALTYLPETLRCLWENLPHLLAGSLFFSMACAPTFVLTVLGLPWLALLAAAGVAAPAYTGLLAFLGDLASDRPPRTLLTGYRLHWLDSLRLAALGSAPLGLALATLPPLPPNLLSPLALFWVALLLLCCLVATVIFLYAFPLRALYPTRLGLLLQNSFLLAARYLTHTLGLLALAVLMGFAVVYASLGLLLILPAMLALFAVTNCLLVVRTELRHV
ncbi:MAG: hypothetical protein ACOYL7_15375 [Caldilinea sp.]|jgi:hypothetical protein